MPPYVGNIPVVSVPSTANVATRPRKESVYDSEAVAVGVHPSEVRIFNDFSAFAAGTVLGQTKVKGRDTNLSGRSGLEKAQHVFWFSITAQIQVRNQDISTVLANQVTYDHLRQIREGADLQFFFTDTSYIRQPYSEIPSGTGPTGISTTHDAHTVLNTIAWGVPHRTNDYSVQIMNRPVEITELETFNVLITLPQVTITLVNAVWHQVHLRGIRLKGIVG